MEPCNSPVRHAGPHSQLMLTGVAVFFTQGNVLAFSVFLGPSDLGLGRRLQNLSHRSSQSLTAANQLFCGKDPNTFNFSLFDYLVLFLKAALSSSTLQQGLTFHQPLFLSGEKPFSQH